MTYRSKTESLKGIKLSGNVCVVCGWNKTDYKGAPLVIGAHVRRFENVADYDKYDNIIALCPNHHIEFDFGNLAIDPIKKICLHMNIYDEYNGKKLVGKIAHVAKGYFDYHNKHVFKGK